MSTNIDELRSKLDGKREVRVFEIDRLEIRDAGEDGFIPFEGHAAVFNKLSDDLGGFREKIAPGAFAKTLKESADVRLLFNHGPDSVMARTASGTLELAEDDIGLGTRAGLDPDDFDVRRVVPKMRRGDVNQMSFGFRTVKDHWDDRDGTIERTLLEVRLFDVSIVTYPAYPQTDAAVRRELEAALRTISDADPTAYAEAFEELRAGKTLSAKNLALVKSAAKALGELLSAAEPDEDDDEGDRGDEKKAYPLELARRRARMLEHMLAS